MCPFCDVEMTFSHDMDGYTVLICPECDTRLHADAFVNKPNA